MTDDQDNAGEVVADTVRVALTAAGRLAEQAARRREADLRDAERDSAARVATVQSQLAAERELALRSVRDVIQRGNTATVEEVMHAWVQARSWDDPAMATEQAHLEEHIRGRLDIHSPSLVTQRKESEHVVAATVVSRDIKVQVGDERQRDAAKSRVAGLRAELVEAGVIDEAAHARALAAESHPTPASHAGQAPLGSSAGRPRGVRRGRVTEIQSPGR